MTTVCFINKTQRLSSIDVLMDEASTALLSIRLAPSTGVGHFLLEGDSLLVILAMNQSLIFLVGSFLLLFLTLD
jgi:hypothetical protein